MIRAACGSAMGVTGMCPFFPSFVVIIEVHFIFLVVSFGRLVCGEFHYPLRATICDRGETSRCT